MSDLSHVPKPGENEPSDTLSGDDEFYFDGPYMVFTEAYHLRRGYCCYSGCRHCPYGFVLPTSSQPRS